MIPLIVGAAIAIHACWLLYASVVDVRDHRVPNRLTLGAASSGLALLALAAIAEGTARPLVRAVGGALVLFGVMLVLYVLSPRNLGAADVKMSFAVGLHIGWFDVDGIRWALLIAWLAFAAVSVVLLVTRRADRRAELPFVPFLSIGALATLAIVAT